MDVKELRIGNLIQWVDNGEIMTVKGIGTKYIASEKIGTIELREVSGIDITEEWLLKAGFEKQGIGYWKVNEDLSNSFSIARINDHFAISFVQYPVYYLHQLQNVYYAFTGQEITFNL